MFASEIMKEGQPQGDYLVDTSNGFFAAEVLDDAVPKNNAAIVTAPSWRQPFR